MFLIDKKRRQTSKKLCFDLYNSNALHLFSSADSFGSWANWTQSPYETQPTASLGIQNIIEYIGNCIDFCTQGLIVGPRNFILWAAKPTYCFVRLSFKRLQWLKLWQMTADGFPLCNMLLNFFVSSVTSCQAELARALVMSFNPDLAHMLMVSGYCFGLLPPKQTVLTGYIVIYLTGLSWWENSELPLTRL